MSKGVHSCWIEERIVCATEDKTAIKTIKMRQQKSPALREVSPIG